MTILYERPVEVKVLANGIFLKSSSNIGSCNLAAPPMLSPKDQHFTPSELAEQMIRCVEMRDVKNVADLAVGQGDLLKAALAQWPGCSLYGVDRDPSMIKPLRKSFPNAKWMVADFFDLTNSSPSRPSTIPPLDLILLNPPFSVRGNGLKTVTLSNETFRCSCAIAFVAQSIEWLRLGGTLVAIVPHGALHSERDSTVMRHLTLSYRVEIVQDSILGKFKGCDVRCAIIVLIRKASKALASKELDNASIAENVKRGSFDHVGTRGLKSRSKTTVRVIHTSNLQLGRISGAYAIAPRTAPAATLHDTPLVVIPRVGKLSRNKVVVIEQPQNMTFTKCTILIECKTVQEAHDIKNDILARWPEFSKCYGGTGAAYTTLKKISEFIRASKICSAGRSVTRAAMHQRSKPKVARTVIKSGDCRKSTPPSASLFQIAV